MLKKYLLVIGIVLFTLTSYTQTVNVKFSARDRVDWIALDSIEITNLTRHWTETIVAPDSSIELAIQTGVACYNTHKKAELKQNIPNPFYGTTNITFYLPQEEMVHFAIFDILGKEDVQQSLKLGAGYHTFKVTLSQVQTYFFTASTSTGICSIKMVNQKKGGSDKIEYIGWQLDNATPSLKKSSCQAFAKGDKMRYRAYATAYGEPLIRTVTQCQYEDATILFDMIPQTHLVDKITGHNGETPFTANYTYDEDKHLTQIAISDSIGNQSYMDFSYLNNRIASVTYRNGAQTDSHHVCHFTYNRLGLLKQRIVTKDEDTLSVEQYEYDSNHWLRTIIADKDTNLIKGLYDRNGNIIRLYVSESDSLGETSEKIMEFKYDYHRKPFFNADYLFTEELFPFALAKVTRIKALAYNNMTEFITEGIQWIHDYNDAGLPISIETKRGKGKDFSTLNIIYKEY